MNVEILHGSVGPHKQGDIVPVTAITGGYPEADRLATMGAVKFTAKPSTHELPAVPDAVMEMDDDELVKENARLRELLARAGDDAEKLNGDLLNQVAVLTVQRDALVAELEVARKATPVARTGRKRKAADAPPEQAEPGNGEPNAETAAGEPTEENTVPNPPAAE